MNEKHTLTPKYRAQKSIDGAAPLDDSAGWIVVSDGGLLCSNMCKAEAVMVACACNSHDALVALIPYVRHHSTCADPVMTRAAGEMGCTCGASAALKAAKVTA